jgi:hypothetical protein
MKGIKAELVADQQKQNNTTCDPDCQAGDIEHRATALAKKIAKSGLKVIFEHVLMLKHVLSQDQCHQAKPVFYVKFFSCLFKFVRIRPVPDAELSVKGFCYEAGHLPLHDVTATDRHCHFCCRPGLCGQTDL